MAVIRIDDFAGINLRQDAKKGAFAQVAENVDLDTNALVPTWGLDVVSRVLLGQITERKTIFHLGGTTILAWTQDAQVATNPLADDSDKRVYFSGTGVPQVTDFALATALANGAYPNFSYTLGMPAAPPINAATSFASGGSGLNQDRAYVYTYVSPWGEESAPSDPWQVTAKETGSTVEIDGIGTRLLSSPVLGAVATFIAVPTPGFMRVTMGGYLAPPLLQSGDRVQLGVRTAVAKSGGNGSFLVSSLPGTNGEFDIAANCWPLTAAACDVRLVAPFNRYIVAAMRQAINVSGVVEIVCRALDGLRAGDGVFVDIPAVITGQFTVLSVIERNATDGLPSFTVAANVFAVFAAVANMTAWRLVPYNVGEVRITNIAFAAGVATLTLDPSAGGTGSAEIEAGDRVLIVGVQGAYQINGVRKIETVPGGGLTVTINIAALGAYTGGGMLIRPVPYAFDEYGVTAVAAAAGGPYPAAFTTDITLNRDHTISPGDLVVGYDLTASVELNTVLAVTALPAANQIRVSMASGHTAWGGGGSIAVVERQSKKRIYRTATGTTDAEYQLVAEIPSEQAHYTDTQDDEKLSSTVLTTDEWIQPPTDLHHIVAHPHRFLQGLSGNLLCQSVPGAPHAWPIALQKAIPVQSAVALAISGQTAIAVTTEKPYAFTGVDPQSMASEVIVAGEPCTSATSFAAAAAASADASAIQGVAYRGRRGIFIAGPGMAQNLTEGLLPASFFNSSPRTVGEFWAGKYVWIDNSAATGYILDPRGGDHALTQFRVEYNVSALHVSPVDGTLWAAYTDTSTVPANVYAAPLFKITLSTVRFDWRSEYRYLPKPVTFGFLLVDFDWASMSVWMKAREDQLVANMRTRRSGVWNSVSFNQAEFNGGLRRHVYVPDTTLVTPSELYLKATVIANPDSADNQAIVFDDFISSDTPVRLDDGIKADVWQVRLLGNVHVTAAILASTMDELRLV